MTLPGGQAQPDRETLPVDNRVDFGREPASGALETMISIPFCRRSLLVRSDGVLSIIWLSPSYAAVIASIGRPMTPTSRPRTK